MEREPLGLNTWASHPAVTSDARQAGDRSSNTDQELHLRHRRPPLSAHSTRATSCRTPASDYYDGSAPSLTGQPTVCPARPATLAAWPPGRPGTVPVFTCRSLDGGGTRLSPCDIAVATPQHVTTASPSAHRHSGEFPRLRDEGGGCASHPAQIRQVRAGASLRGVKRRFLAYAFPPRSPHPRHLAVPTRHGFVGAACHPSRHLPRPAAPSFTALLRQDRGEGLSPPLNQQAPHGAPVV